MHFDVIAFDADDTLWHSETYYHDTQAALTAIMAPYHVDAQRALDVLHQIEIANLPSFGFGIKGFTISMVEAAIEATGGKISTADIRAIIDLGRAMTAHEIRLLDQTGEVVEALAKSHTLMLVTKGDLMDQERKIAGSGLAGYFQQVEIVSDKTPEVFRGLLRKHQLHPERFLMIGNSMRSDILPVLEIGGWAVYVPYALTWAHEIAEAPSGTHRFFEIAHLGQLPDLVTQIENGYDIP